MDAVHHRYDSTTEQLSFSVTVVFHTQKGLSISSRALITCLFFKLPLIQELTSPQMPV